MHLRSQLFRNAEAHRTPLQTIANGDLQFSVSESCASIISYFKTENDAYLLWESLAFPSPRGMCLVIEDPPFKVFRQPWPQVLGHTSPPSTHPHGRRRGLQGPRQQLWPLGGQTSAGWLHPSLNGDC